MAENLPIGRALPLAWMSCYRIIPVALEWLQRNKRFLLVLLEISLTQEDIRIPIKCKDPQTKRLEGEKTMVTEKRSKRYWVASVKGAFNKGGEFCGQYVITFPTRSAGQIRTTARISVLQFRLSYLWPCLFGTFFLPSFLPSLRCNHGPPCAL